jgi:hypothetical protein
MKVLQAGKGYLSQQRSAGLVLLYKVTGKNMQNLSGHILYEYGCAQKASTA